jgi:hypothetical protein
MRPNMILGEMLAGLSSLMAGRRASLLIADDFGVPNQRRTCPKTVSAAALKRAAKKRRNMRARSPK